MITQKDINPIPKYMLAIIKRKDKQHYETPCGNSRFYAYLAVWKGELVKVTVAVRHKYRKWYCKQVAVHSLRSDISYVKDLCFYQIAGYVVGWFDVGASEKAKDFEDSVWYENDTSLFDPYAPVVNLDASLICSLQSFKIATVSLSTYTRTFFSPCFVVTIISNFFIIKSSCFFDLKLKNLKPKQEGHDSAELLELCR